MAESAPSPSPRAAWAEWAVRGLLVAAFLVLVGRFAHPYHGFTRFIQFDEASVPTAVPEIHAAPLFLYPGENGYDAIAYLQIAFHPGLDSPALDEAVDHLPYRARRIGVSALAWMVAGGDETRIAQDYALINPVAWLVLAALLWLVLPAGDWRRTAAWAGVLFSAGALHSVRLALTDLPALVLTVAAVSWLERGKRFAPPVALALATLTRETAVLGVVALVRDLRAGWRDLLRQAALAGLAVVPLAAWLAWLHFRLGPSDPGVGNLTLPVVGFLEKWRAAVAGAMADGPHAWLMATTLLATAGLTAQAAYFAWRRVPGDPWWRLGVAFAGLMLFLGTPVWEGQPGAATRVLLPLTLAFNVLAARQRAPWGWLVAGNLTVLSGVLALWHVPRDLRELATGTVADAAYVARTDASWHAAEKLGPDVWAWSGYGGDVRIETWPRADRKLALEVAVMAMTPREVVVSVAGRERWRGEVTREPRWIELGDVEVGPDGVALAIRSTAPLVSEGPGGRNLGVGAAGVKVREAGARP